HSFNSILQNPNKPFPCTIKHSKLILLYKNGNPLKALNYRPITLQETIYKLFCNIVNKRLLTILIENNIISEEQAGFTPEKSLEHNLLKTILTIENSIRFSKPIFILTIDIKKAFDSIPIKNYPNLLKLLKFDYKTINLIMKILNNNKIFFIDHLPNQYIPQTKGTPQGSPISPIIFNLFLEPLIRKIKASGLGFKWSHSSLSCSVLAYADDLIIFSDSHHKIQKIYNFIEDYLEQNDVHINPNKCEYACREPNSNNKKTETLYTILTR